MEEKKKWKEKNHTGKKGRNEDEPHDFFFFPNRRCVAASFLHV
jgi:hypothetical protein